MARKNNKKNPRSFGERVTFGMFGRRFRRFENAEELSRGHQPPAYEGPPRLQEVAIADAESARTQSSDAIHVTVANPNQDQLALVTPPGGNPTNPGSARSSRTQDALLISYETVAPGPPGSTEPPGPPPDPSSSVNRAISDSAPSVTNQSPRLRDNDPGAELPRPPGPPVFQEPTGPQGSAPDTSSSISQDLLISDHSMRNPPPRVTPPPGFYSGADIDRTVYSICKVEFGQRRGKHFFQEQKAYLPCGHAFGHQCIFWWLSWNRIRRGVCPRGDCISVKHECGHMAVPTTQPNKHLFTDTMRTRIPWPCEFCRRDDNTAPGGDQGEEVLGNEENEENKEAGEKQRAKKKVKRSFLNFLKW
ncbi:hypothetical protein B0J13DRAFT_522401 [Dactylonectria estremocensis]|uniref:Zinc finger RING-type eukaryotic domain-containing protein n=1 Tax=Dactylonectria estremocensis TaxID=1079267 RepID=A0A9P9F3Q2_9HYPO|nr:hypothetical protein B0J13DRAFT_522401 [Dactylonectria estremocensis]